VLLPLCPSGASNGGHHHQVQFLVSASELQVVGEDDHADEEQTAEDANAETHKYLLDKDSDKEEATQQHLLQTAINSSLD
jgi:hypothetical protein